MDAALQAPRPKELLFFPEQQFSSRYGDKFFTISIRSYDKVVDSCFTGYVEYLINIRKGQLSWTVKKRFSAFDSLLRELKLRHQSSVHLFPALPPKTCLPVVQDDAFINERKDNLQQFLDDLLTSMTNEKIIGDEGLLDFFNFPN